MASQSFVFRFAEVEVEEREYAISRAGEALSVEPKVFRVLLILLRNRGKLIPKRELLDAVWGDAAVTENSLARAIAVLRKLLGETARTPRFIETVNTVGYRFVGKVAVTVDTVFVSEPPDPVLTPATVDTANGARSRFSPSKRLASCRFTQTALLAAAAVTALLLALCIWYATRLRPAAHAGLGEFPAPINRCAIEEISLKSCLTNFAIRSIFHLSVN
jgi:DNA-binding winged helix-turn-helix (wHTH) protein